MRVRCQARTRALQERLGEVGIDIALIVDADTIYYLAHYWGYLGLDFGRPTALVVPRDGAPAIVTPEMEAEMCRALTWVEDVRPWVDGVGEEWRGPLAALIEADRPRVLGIEARRLPPPIDAFLREAAPGHARVDVEPPIAAMRMIKDAEEIAIMRQAGAVAVAMVEGAHGAIAEGVPEYEVALAVIAAGTREAAGFLSPAGAERFHAPVIHNLQILQSGTDTAMVHRRASVRPIRRGDAIYLCFCGIANFKNYRLGFDREFFVGEVRDEEARLYETTVAAQAAALATIRPGVPAEEVHFAAEAVYREAGFAAGYRTGRGIGCSFLEPPELKAGDRTVLAPGMCFAVDGGLTVPGRFGARVGDSVVVTEAGYEVLTPYPKTLAVL